MVQRSLLLKKNGFLSLETGSSLQKYAVTAERNTAPHRIFFEGSLDGINHLPQPYFTMITKTPSDSNLGIICHTAL